MTPVSAFADVIDRSFLQIREELGHDSAQTGHGNMSSRLKQATKHSNTANKSLHSAPAEDQMVNDANRPRLH